MAGFIKTQINRDSKQLETKAYKTEKELENKICDNIQAFCSNVLQDDYVAHWSQVNLLGRVGGNKRTEKGALTVDIKIQCKRGKYLLELKNPIYKSENRAAIGQILNYGRLMPGYKMVLCTTKIDIDTAETIDFYKLPIIYVFLDDGRFAIHSPRYVNG